MKEPTRLERRELGPAAVEYVRSRLEGGKTLSRLLLDIDLGGGIAFAFLSPELTTDDAHDFESGLFPITEEPIPLAGEGSMAGVPAGSLGYGMGFIEDFISTGADRLCLLEDATAEPTDSWLQRERYLRYVVHGSEIYYVAGQEEAMMQTIVDALTRQRIGVLSETPGADASLVRGGEIGQQVLESIVGGLRYIVVRAYRGEGHVFWERPAV